jgi:hypothetical protein
MDKGKGQRAEGKAQRGKLIAHSEERRAGTRGVRCTEALAVRRRRPKPLTSSRTIDLQLARDLQSLTQELVT